MYVIGDMQLPRWRTHCFLLLLLLTYTLWWLSLFLLLLYIILHKVVEIKQAVVIVDIFVEYNAAYKIL